MKYTDYAQIHDQDTMGYLIIMLLLLLLHLDYFTDVVVRCYPILNIYILYLKIVMCWSKLADEEVD